MADSLEDLNEIEIWRPDPNWREVIEYAWDIDRQVLNFDGTIDQVIANSQEKLHRFSFTVSCQTKAEQKTLIDKFIELKGRYQKFWFLNPFTLFTLHTAIEEDDTEIVVKQNNYEISELQRIYILLDNGDLITREITGQVDGIDTMTFSLATPMDRAIEIANIVLISILHLCRLQNDTLEMRNITDTVAEANIAIQELSWLEMPDFEEEVGEDLILSAAIGTPTYPPPTCTSSTQLNAETNFSPTHRKSIKIYTLEVGGTLLFSGTGTRSDSNTINIARKDLGGDVRQPVSGWIQVSEKMPSGFTRTSVNRVEFVVYGCQVTPITDTITINYDPGEEKVKVELPPEAVRKYDSEKVYKVKRYTNKYDLTEVETKDVEYISDTEIRFEITEDTEGYWEIVEDGIVVNSPRIYANLVLEEVFEGDWETLEYVDTNTGNSYYTNFFGDSG